MLYRPITVFINIYGTRYILVSRRVSCNSVALISSMCVCVFFPFILDIKFVGRTRRGHTGFLIYLLSAVRAFIFHAGRISMCIEIPSVVRSNKPKV